MPPQRTVAPSPPLPRGGAPALLPPEAASSPPPPPGVSSITPLQQVAASCSGALLTSVLTTPFDVVKVRLQAQQRSTALQPCYLMECRCLDGVTVCVVTPEGDHVRVLRLRGTLDAFFKIANAEGIRSWWKGLSPTLLMAVPSTVIYYTMYDQLKIQFGFRPDRRNIQAPMFAGIIARTMAVSAISPIELVRTKLQSRQGYSYVELVGIVRSAVRQNGVLSLWRGLSPTLLRDVPFSALYWVGYEALKRRMTSGLGHEWTFLIPFLAGSLSGAMASILTNPLDVAKTHMQVDLGESLGERSLGRGSLRSVLQKVVAEHGLSGLYAGLVPRTAKIAPACAIMIGSYEAGKRYFGQYNSSRHSEEGFYPNR